MVKGHIKTCVHSLNRQGPIPSIAMVKAEIQRSVLEIEMSLKFEAGAGRKASEGSSKELQVKK